MVPPAPINASTAWPPGARAPAEPRPTPASRLHARVRPHSDTSAMRHPFLSLPVRPLCDLIFAFAARISGLPLLPPDPGYDRDLLHPCRDLALVEVVQGFELHAPRGLAHRHRRHRGYRIERRAV